MIVSSARLPLNEPFSVISDDPAFTESNKALAHLKTTQKSGDIAGLLEPIRNARKPISKEQEKKLYDSGEFGQGESKNPAQLQRIDLVLSPSLFRPTRRENQRQLTPTILSLRKTHQGASA